MVNMLERLVFIDETSLMANLVKTIGRAPVGRRLICHAAFGHAAFGHALRPLAHPGPLSRALPGTG